MYVHTRTHTHNLCAYMYIGYARSVIYLYVHVHIERPEIDYGSPDDVYANPSCRHVPNPLLLCTLLCVGL